MVLDADPDLGVRFPELLQDREQEEVEGGLAGAHADNALMESGEHLQLFLCGLELFHGDLHMRIQPFPLGGQ